VKSPFFHGVEPERRTNTGARWVGGAGLALGAHQEVHGTLLAPRGIVSRPQNVHDGVRSFFIVGTIFLLDTFPTRVAPTIEVGCYSPSSARSA
jgi:hypothetical protein